jgi:hypothetical protein
MVRFLMTGAAVAATAGLFAAPASAVVPPVGPGPSTAYSVQSQPPAGSCHYWQAANGEPLPDPDCTPGAVSPVVTQDNLASTICHPGYVDSIRPPRQVMAAEKQRNAESYGFTGDLAQARYDYLVPLELGGDPNDSRNLWVEPPDPGQRAADGTGSKESIEHKLNALVCSGKMPLTAAQEAISHDWTTALGDG